VVKRPESGLLAYAEERLIEAATSDGRFRVTPTQDCAEINAERLSEVAAVVFYTTGELPIPGDGKHELMDWLHAGGAFVGIHCATDTFYEFPAYVDMIGGLFDGHPWHQDVNVRVEDPKHPAVAHLGDAFGIKDEIYQHRNYRRYPLYPLLTLDPESCEIEKGKRSDGDSSGSQSTVRRTAPVSSRSAIRAFSRLGENIGYRRTRTSKPSSGSSSKPVTTPRFR